MSVDMTLFAKPEAKTKTVTVRLTQSQKTVIISLAERMNTSISQVLLCSIGEMIKHMEE